MDSYNFENGNVPGTQQVVDIENEKNPGTQQVVNSENGKIPGTQLVVNIENRTGQRTQQEVKFENEKFTQLVATWKNAHNSCNPTDNDDIQDPTIPTDSVSHSILHFKNEISATKEDATQRNERSVSFLLPIDECKKEEIILQAHKFPRRNSTVFHPSTLLTCVVPVCREKIGGLLEQTIEPSVITKKDGSRIIITEEGTKRLPPPKKVKHKEIELLKIFCAFSVILSPPFGLLVLAFTIKTMKEYKNGIIDGNMNKTYVWKKRTEGLVILAIVTGLLFWGALLIVLQMMDKSESADLEATVASQLI